ncbi:peptidoglycan DD-metalloendopeptidase family protein [Nocardioides pacificus]
MRSFPRAARRRLPAATAAFALALGALTSPAASTSATSSMSASLRAADDLEDKQQKVEKQIDRAHDDLDESSAAYRRAATKLGSAQTSLTTARTHLQEVRARLFAARLKDARMKAALAKAEERLTTAREALVTSQDDVEDQRGVVSGVVTSFYKDGDPELLAFASALGAEDPADLTRGTKARDVIVGQETRAYDDLRATEVLLGVKEKSVARARNQVATQREAAADQLVTVRETTQEAWAATASVRKLVESRRTAATQANRIKARDQRILKRLEREEDKIQDMLRRRAAQAKRQAGGNQRVSNPGGFLSWPVANSYVTSAFGMRTHPIHGYYSLHDGTDFGVACGQPLYAAADGRVASRYYQTAYGNRLIVDHGYVRGVGLASIYNHASRYVVGAGERVKRGQLIGYVGNTGWSTGCHLHYTVMVNGNPVNPMSWL